MRHTAKIFLTHTVCVLFMLQNSACIQKSPPPQEDTSSSASFIPQGNFKSSPSLAAKEQGGDENSNDPLSTHDTLCAEFHDLVNLALDNHLFRSRKDKQVLLTQAISYIDRYPDDSLSYAQWKTMFDDGVFVQLPDNKLEQCSLIERLAKKFSHEDFLKIEDLKKRELVKNKNAYLRTYKYMVLMMDGGFSGIRSLDDRLGKDELVSSGGLIFAQRPDYLYPLKQSSQTEVRHPNYLYIQSAYPQNQFTQANSELIGKYVTHICLSKEACDPVNLRSYTDNLERINNETHTNVLLKLKDPKTLDTSDYTLSIRELNKLYAFSYTYPNKDQEHPSFIIKIKSFLSKNLGKSVRRILTEDIATYQEHYGMYPPQIIIDLRDNNGGYIDQAVELLENFLPKKSLVNISLSVVTPEEKGRFLEKKPDLLFKQMLEKEFLVQGWFTDNDFRPDIFIQSKPKIIVLVNRQSASASEIFAAAMKDYGVALIVGEQSFGKGMGQEADDKAFSDYKFQLVLTKDYHFSPQGTSHLLHPHFLDKQHNDPFDQSPFDTVGDILALFNFNHFDKPLIDAPKNLSVDFEPTVPPLLEPDTIEHLQLNTLPSSCNVPNDFSQIKEEEDCLLDIANAYFSQWETL